MTGKGQYADLNTLVSVAEAVKDNNAFERAVANHASM